MPHSEEEEIVEWEPRIKETKTDRECNINWNTEDKEKRTDYETGKRETWPDYELGARGNWETGTRVKESKWMQERNRAEGIRYDQENLNQKLNLMKFISKVANLAEEDNENKKEESKEATEEEMKLLSLTNLLKMVNSMKKGTISQQENEICKQIGHAIAGLTVEETDNKYKGETNRIERISRKERTKIEKKEDSKNSEKWEIPLDQSILGVDDWKPRGISHSTPCKENLPRESRPQVREVKRIKKKITKWSPSDYTSDHSSDNSEDSSRNNQEWIGTIHHRRNRNVPEPSIFNPEETITFSRFLEKFERYCKSKYSHDKDDWIEVLGKFLKGDMRRIYRQGKMTDKSYDHIISKLKEWYAGKRRRLERDWKREFEEMKMEEGENLHTYMLRLEDTALAVFPDIELEDNGELRKKFMRTAPQSFTTRIREESFRRVDTGLGELTWAGVKVLASMIQDQEEIVKHRQLRKWDLSPDRELMEIRAAVGLPQVKQKYGQMTNRTAIENKSESEYNDTSLWGERRYSREQKWVPVCYYCKGRGHLERECRRKLGLCLRCGERGHFRNQCSVKYGELQRNKSWSGQRKSREDQHWMTKPDRDERSQERNRNREETLQINWMERAPKYHQRQDQYSRRHRSRRDTSTSSESSCDRCHHHRNRSHSKHHHKAHQEMQRCSTRGVRICGTGKTGEQWKSYNENEKRQNVRDESWRGRKSYKEREDDEYRNIPVESNVMLPGGSDSVQEFQGAGALN